MITTFQEYQEATSKTAIYPKEKAIEYLLLGLMSECGEIAGKYKKILRDDKGVLNEENTKGLVFEQGDALWYMSELCNVLNVKLSDVVNYNINKLQDRYNRNTLSGSGDKR